MPGQSETCIVGESSFVQPFRATGIDIYSEEEGKVKEIVDKILARNYKIIFYEEKLYPYFAEKEAQLKDKVFPCLVPLPSFKKEKKLGIQRLKKLIKRAVGIEIYMEEK